MPIHVAILKRLYLNLILSGQKTVESRLTRTAQPPLGCIAPGERIFLKASSGPFMATAVAGKIEQHDNLEPYDILRLRLLHDRTVCGDDAYWELKKDSRFAVFVELTEVEPIEVGPKYPKSMRAWHVVDDKLNPLMDVTLTAGAIRNRYLSLPGTSEKLRQRKLTLLMPDGEEVATGFSAGKPMLKWRGWGEYYEAHHMNPGDVARVVALGAGRYRVTFLRRKP